MCLLSFTSLTALVKYAIIYEKNKLFWRLYEKFQLYGIKKYEVGF